MEPVITRQSSTCVAIHSKPLYRADTVAPMGATQREAMKCLSERKMRVDHTRWRALIDRKDVILHIRLELSGEALKKKKKIFYCGVSVRTRLSFWCVQCTHD